LNAEQKQTLLSSLLACRAYSFSFTLFQASAGLPALPPISRGKTQLTTTYTISGRSLVADARKHKIASSFDPAACFALLCLYGAFMDLSWPMKPRQMKQ
jgi:hypothetical protein